MATRQDLIEQVSKAIEDVPSVDVASAVEITFDYIVDSLLKGDRVEIRGFGSFYLGKRRIAPGTNLAKPVLAHKEVKTVNYRISDGLRAQIN